MALPEGDPQRPDDIILSGHSQGSVICAAVVLQLPAGWRARIWFFSYGCQLTRLYGRIFPAYFGLERLPVGTELLVSNPRSTCTGPTSGGRPIRLAGRSRPANASCWSRIPRRCTRAAAR